MAGIGDCATRPSNRQSTFRVRLNRSRQATGIIRVCCPAKRGDPNPPSWNSNALPDMQQPVMPRSQPAVADRLLLLTLSTLWGASYTFIRIGVETIPPLTLIAARTLIAGSVLLMWMRIRRIPTPRDLPVWQRFFVQALLNSVVPFTLIARAALAVFSTALALVIYFRLVQTLGSVGTTAQAYLRVPIGIGISMALLGESLSASARVGLGCVVAGVIAMTLPSRQRGQSRT